MRKTKIVCTIGPACEDKETLKKMILAGMNVARFNMSHGTHESHHVMIENLKRAREELGVPVAIMIDTKGPEIRVKQFENGSIFLSTGEEFTLTTREVLGNNKIVSVTQQNFNEIVKEKDIVLINDGLIKLEVKKVCDKDVICKVKIGGKLMSNKGVNIPGVDLKIPYLSNVDRDDIIFGVKEGADIFSLSFVGSKNDVLEVRKLLDKYGSNALICSKIESHLGIKNIDEIIDVSDSIMVARGDLGVEIAFEKIPYFQKQLIQKCIKKGKNVITATEMLESMIENPRPTRAEISDIANAVLDSSSAIMLSGETSIGKNPVLSVKTMSNIALATEETINYSHDIDCEDAECVGSSIGYAACELARSLKAKAIVVATSSGFASKSVSRFRPAAKIIACTPNKNVYNQMAIYWGVYPILDKEHNNIDELLVASREKAIKSELISKKDVIVQTASLVTGKSGSNLLYVPEIK